jgi:hypothetical protein
MQNENLGQRGRHCSAEEVQVEERDEAVIRDAPHHTYSLFLAMGIVQLEISTHMLWLVFSEHPFKDDCLYAGAQTQC